jgi:outer membrane protein assembly factor BamB
MKIAKDKTVAIALILLLTVSAAIAVANVQEAHAADIPTFLFMTASPNPVGKGQVCYVGAMFSRPPPTLSSMGTGYFGDMFENVTITIIDPDGVKTDFFFRVTSPAAGVQISYTPSKLGNYTIQAHYPGQILVGSNPLFPTVGGGGAQWRGSYMLPSDSNILTLVVQEDWILPIYQTPPVPTEFWTRPIYGTNWNWAEDAANWFGLGGSGIGGDTYARNFQPAGSAPNSAHIMWTMPTQLGGQPGAPVPGDETAPYSGTSLLISYFKPQCIINGILFYNKFAYRGTFMGWRAVDIHTGEILWEKSAAEVENLRIDWGQVYNYMNFQEFGSAAHIYTTVSGGSFKIYDPLTGQYLANVTDARSTSKIINYDSTGLRGEVVGYYVASGNLCMYNYTKLLQNPASWPVSVSGNINATTRNPVVWQTPLPTTFGGDNISLSIAGVTLDVILMRQVPNSMALANSGYAYDAGYDAKTGNLLWGPFNHTWLDYKYESVDLLCCNDGYYVLHNKDRDQAYGYSLTTGKQLWGPVQLPGSGYSPIQRSGMIGYGKVYISDLGGYVNAIDLETGEVAWTFYAGDSGVDTPFESYPIMGYNSQSMADGKLFLTEGIMYTPPEHPSYRLAINCTDGTLVWKVLQYASTCTGPIADGFLISWNSFDDQIYCFGKGPSATTVTIQDDVVTLGDSVLVKGTVMDTAGGTKQDVITTRFPDGLPAMSDDSQEAWMEYAYMQQVRPANATGVDVTISVLDPNGNFYDVGTTTSNDMGFYKLSFTPAVPGEYSIYATFSGSESYYGSKAVNSVTVENAPMATPAPTPTPAPMTDTYVMGFGIALILVVIIGFALLFLLLRKR